MEYDTVIGLEVHAQLNTETKIFCSCPTAFGKTPNSQVCPVCCGMPGVLPVLNREVLRKAVLAGLATGCEISKFSKFDRKNYFYPDLPKAYQISQFDKPICKNGFVEVTNGDAVKKIRLNRIHMEEDAGKNIHSDDTSQSASFVDLNRAGVPLIEIVTEPDISSADEAYEFLSSLKKILKYIEVSDCNMEEGSLRADVNISLKPKGSDKLGEKVEIKNMNSFKSIKATIEYEQKRQRGKLEDGERILQETRLWDPDKGRTSSMRSKEEAHDYRYFPDPDLPPVCVDDDYINERRNELPELPAAKYGRFRESFSLPHLDADVLTSTRALADYYEKTIKLGADPKKASNWIVNELLAIVPDAENAETIPVSAEALAELISLIDTNVISGKIAKGVLTDCAKSGKMPGKIVEEKGLKQVTDTGEIEKIVDEVLAQNQSIVEEIRAGKDKAKGFLVGQIMKASRGKANPQMVNEILAKKI